MMVQIKYWYRVIKKKTNQLDSGVYFSYETMDGCVYALTPSQAADIVEKRITKITYAYVVLDSITIRLGHENGDVVLRTMASDFGKAGELVRILEKPAFRAPVTPAKTHFPAQNDRWGDDEVPLHRFLTVIHNRNIYPILKEENFR